MMNQLLFFGLQDLLCFTEKTMNLWKVGKCQNITVKFAEEGILLFSVEQSGRIVDGKGRR